VNRRAQLVGHRRDELTALLSLVTSTGGLAMLPISIEGYSRVRGDRVSRAELERVLLRAQQAQRRAAQYDIADSGVASPSGAAVQRTAARTTGVICSAPRTQRVLGNLSATICLTLPRPTRSSRSRGVSWGVAGITTRPRRIAASIDSHSGVTLVSITRMQSLRSARDHHVEAIGGLDRIRREVGPCSCDRARLAHLLPVDEGLTDACEAKRRAFGVLLVPILPPPIPPRTP
jgi:hypothetical protein